MLRHSLGTGKPVGRGNCRRRAAGHSCRWRSRGSKTLRDCDPTDSGNPGLLGHRGADRLFNAGFISFHGRVSGFHGGIAAGRLGYRAILQPCRDETSEIKLTDPSVLLEATVNSRSLLSISCSPAPRTSSRSPRSPNEQRAERRVAM